MLVDDVARLAAELHQHADHAQTEMTTFPSGAVSLLVRIGARAFELAFLPSYNMFAVDELDDPGFDTGYRFGFQDFISAKAKLVELLDEARVAATCEPRRG